MLTSAVALPFQKKKKSKTKISSNLKTRCDFSIRDNATILRKLDTDIKPNEPTGGQRILTLKLTADYAISNKFTVRFFFDRVVNTVESFFFTLLIKTSIRLSNESNNSSRFAC